jgi:MFS family permease
VIEFLTQGPNEKARMKTLFARIFGGLWQRPAFVKLWASNTISAFGSQITLLALPLTAALLLQASPSQMGLLVAMELLPFGLFSLHAGAIIDRGQKLALVKFAAISRGCLLLVVPLAAYFGWLRMEILYAIAFLMSSLAVFADVAYQTLIAKLVGREELVEANAKFGLSESSASIAGPSLAGALVQWLTAPFAIIFDALSFFLSGCILRSIKLHEPEPCHRPPEITLWHEIREGLRAVWSNRILRWTASLLAAWQFLNHMFAAIFVLFAVREVGLSAGMVGMVFSGGGIGFFVASLYVRQLSRAIGLGRTILAGLLTTALGWGLICFVQGPGEHAIAGLTLALFCEGLGAGLFFLTYIGLRQGVTPEVLLGRVISTTRFITIAATPLGALLGGALGDAIGLRLTIALVGAGGIVLSAVATLYSPLKQLKEMPEPMTTPSGLPATAEARNAA